MPIFLWLTTAPYSRSVALGFSFIRRVTICGVAKTVYAVSTSATGEQVYPLGHEEVA
jgi:hypothetical protein